MELSKSQLIILDYPVTCLPVLEPVFFLNCCTMDNTVKSEFHSLRYQDYNNIIFDLLPLHIYEINILFNCCLIRSWLQMKTKNITDLIFFKQISIELVLLCFLAPAALQHTQ